MKRPGKDVAGPIRCAHFETTCEILAAPLTGGTVSAQAAEAARQHVQQCAECAGALRTAAELRRGRAAFAAPEPDDAYWDGFAGQLDARLRREPLPDIRRRPTAAFSSRALRAALAAAAAIALVAGGLAVRRAMTTVRPEPGEAELLERLDSAPSEQIAELLDEIAPPEIDAAADDLADAGDLLHDAGSSDVDDGEDDPTFGPGGDDRDPLPEETRGEIG